MEGTSDTERPGSHPTPISLTPPDTREEPSAPEAREEHSGLHEIRELARTTKTHISRRASTQSEADDSYLASSASLSEIALPQPGKEKPIDLESVSTVAGLSAPAVEAPVVGASVAAASERSGGAAKTIAAAVVVIAAAAVVAVIYLRGNDGGGAAGTGSETAAAPASLPPTGDDAPEVAAAPSVTPMGEVEEADEANDDSAGDPSLDVASTDDSPGAETGAASAGTERREPRPAAEAGKRTAEDRERRRAEAAAAADRSDDERRPSRDDSRDEPAAPSPTDDGPRDDEALAEAAGAAGAAGGGGDLDDVLDSVTGGLDESESEPAPSEPDTKPSKTRLDRSDVAKAMDGVRDQAKACHSAEDFTGTVSIKFTVAPSGAVTKAKATGAHKSSPTGSCVAGAVKSAKFPAYSGRPTSFTFPFLLAQ